MAASASRWPAPVTVVAVVAVVAFGSGVAGGLAIAGREAAAGFEASASCADDRGDAEAIDEAGPSAAGDLVSGRIEVDGHWVHVEMATGGSRLPEEVGVVVSPVGGEEVDATVETFGGSSVARAYLDRQRVRDDGTLGGRRYVSLPEPDVDGPTVAFRFPQSLLGDGDHDVVFWASNVPSPSALPTSLDPCPKYPATLTLVPGVHDATPTDTALPSSSTTTSRPTPATTERPGGASGDPAAAWETVLDGLGTVQSTPVFDRGGVPTAVTASGFRPGPPDAGTLTVWEHDEDGWRDVAKIGLDFWVQASPEQALRLVDATGDGTDDVVVMQSAATSTWGSVLSRNGETWALVPFGDSTQVAVEGLEVHDDPDLVVLNRARSCDPSCAEGGRTITTWTYDPASRIFQPETEPSGTGQDADTLARPLIDAWQAGDRSGALDVATAPVVDLLFADPAPPDVTLLACQSADTGRYECGIGLEGSPMGYGVVLVVDPDQSPAVIDAYTYDE